MKLVNSTGEKKSFEPLTLTLTLENAQECRAFFHVLNHAKLFKRMDDCWYDDVPIGNRGYEPIGQHPGEYFACGDAKVLISDHLEKHKESIRCD